jgi:DNA-binding NarL/FixJ family response regulator
MLTDDDSVLRKELKLFIGENPEIRICGEERNGLELMVYLYRLSRARQALPDLVILDISMPYLGGIETARQIKMLYPSVKILLLSIHSNKEYFEYAAAGGADGYLSKSGMDKELLAAIKTIRAGAFYRKNSKGAGSDTEKCRESAN